MRLLKALTSRSLSLGRHKQRVTMVVGMHRSGTSFLTGSLQQAGLELGKHSAWNPHNLKGNRENTDIVELNDAILATHGCSWDSPPHGNPSWTEEQLAQGKAIISNYNGVSHWGFKDPRTILVIDGWRQLLPTLEFVGIFRHPLAVAKSLEARGGMPLEKSLSLWSHYNHRLLNLYTESPFPVLCFDEPESSLLAKLSEIICTKGLNSQAAVGDGKFFSGELKHHDVPQGDLPEDVADLYKELQRISC